MYAREFKLSRLSYDEILAQASAEWMFEYGMLKIRNHADGFQDAVDSSIPDHDTEMFKLLTPRSKWLEMKYEIESQTGSYTTDIKQNEFLVIPLFVADWEDLSNESMKPLKNDAVTPVSNVVVNWLNSDTYWTIVVSNGQESVALQGKGDNFIEGRIDMKAYYCTYIDSSDNTKHFESDVPCLDNDNTTDPEVVNYQNTQEDKREELLYSYEIKDVSVSDFLNNDDNHEFIVNANEKVKIQRKNPYLIIYNDSSNDLNNVVVDSKSDKKFALPRYTLTATATKGDASQIFRFSEDKGAVYDALKYGYYDPTN